MDLFTEILAKFGIKDYDQLNEAEQATLREMVDKVEKAKITLEDVKKAIASMREAIEADLVKVETTGRKDLFLKARLRNVILLETILTRPDRARASLETYIEGAKIQPK